MDNVRIARSLLRLAKELVAGFDTYMDNKAQYEENIKDKARLDGFTLSYDEDDDMVFTYDKDETGGCSIVFGEIDGGDWGYTIYIDGEESGSVEKEHSEEAWQDLLANASKYAERMDKAIGSRDQGDEDDVPASSMGVCSIRESTDKGEFKGRNNAFRYMLSGGEPVYEATFAPGQGTDAGKVKSSLKSIKEYVGQGMPVVMKNGAIKFQLINRSDMDYVKGVIRGAGWTLA